MSRVRTLAVTTFAALAGLLLLAAPAFAHVTVSAPGATRGGGDQQITFRCPVEEDSNTVKLSISFPTNHPIASLDVVPVPGWTHAEKVVKLKTPIKTDDGPITEAVSEVTWTATAGGLKPGEIGLFNLVAGQLPDAKSLTFPAIQTYANGNVVHWTEIAAPGSKDEPENPAPVLDLAAPSASDSSATTDAAATSSSSSSSSTTGPTILSIIALVLAAAALALAVVSRARRTSGSGQS